MRVQYTQLDFKGQRIWVGLDVAKKSWKVCIIIGTLHHRTFTMPPEPVVLANYLRRNFPGGSYLCVYEAGYFGFWIQKALVRIGIPCMVINPADVPTTHKEKTRKNDRVDTQKLGRSLSNGELRGIYVPSTTALRARSLVRMRATFVSKQTRCKNQIKAYLEFYGERPPEDLARHHWSRRYIAYVEEVQRGQNDEALEALLKELLYLREMIKDLTRRVRTLSHHPRYALNVRLLLTIPGIGVIGAMTLLTEIVSIGRFRRLEHLACFVGLVPTEHSTGETVHIGELTPRKSRALRHMIVEAAWIAVRQDPSLMQVFLELSKRMPKTDAIIRIARKLLNRIRFVLKNHQSYTTTLATE
jgi:transposase